MSKRKGYAPRAAAAPLAPYSFERREPAGKLLFDDLVSSYEGTARLSTAHPLLWWSSYNCSIYAAEDGRSAHNCDGIERHNSQLIFVSAQT